MRQELKDMINKQVLQRRMGALRIESLIYSYEHGWDEKRATQDGWQLGKHTAVGNRVQRIQCNFSFPFQSPPHVSVALAGLDMDKQPLRIKLGVEDVTETDFTLTIFTWQDSEVYGVQVQWTAIGS